MAKLLTLKDKLNKTLEYCEYIKQSATNAGNEVRYLVAINNTVEIGTDQQCAESKNIVYGGDNITFLHTAICQAVLDAKQYSIAYNCLSSVKVWVMHYNSECELINEDPIDEYEINFEKGIEVL